VERQLALVRRVLGADDEGGDAKVGDLDLAGLLVPDDVVWLSSNTRMARISGCLFYFIIIYYLFSIIM
jgi:hypothetical protein